MPFKEWTVSLNILNKSERTIQLKADQLLWGYRRGDFKNKIEPGKDATYQWYSLGAPYGVEFILTFVDIPDEGNFPWGIVEIKIDMPFSIHKNISWCKTTGLLRAKGFTQVPDGVHTHSTSVIISNKDIDDILKIYEPLIET